MRAWIDIDNPPQVQYLLPLKAALERAGAHVVVTARELSITQDLLRNRGIDFRSVGKGFGRSKAAKAIGTLRRARSLAKLVGADGHPDLLVAGSRASALAARFLGLPAFAFCDYEYVELASARLTRSFVFHPDVIDESVLTSRGLRSEQLIAFPGIKENISFSEVDLDAEPPHSFPELRNHELPRVLFRPPSESTHYYTPKSRTFAMQLTEHLAGRSDVVVVFTPRHPQQASVYLDHVRWINQPVQLREAVPFVSLLKAVDGVVSSGGTMLREAAYLGIPAYSILRSGIGCVDRYLEAIGRLRVMTAPEEFEAPEVRRGGFEPLEARSQDLVGDLVHEMMQRL